VNLYDAYRTLPISERYCTGCGDLIERNLALHDGDLFHWGCLKNTERFGHTVAICYGCFSFLTNSKIARISYDASGADSAKQCALCGSPHLRFLNRRTSEEAEWQ
jgi:hypothetical protein